MGTTQETLHALYTNAVKSKLVLVSKERSTGWHVEEPQKGLAPSHAGNAKAWTYKRTAAETSSDVS